MPDINIKQIIHEELNILVDLFYFMEKLKNGILNNEDVKSLNYHLSKISEKALELSKLEKQRIRIFEETSKMYNLKNTLNAFIDFFSKTDREVSDELKKMAEILLDISSTNETLKELLKTKLEYNDILIKLYKEPNNIPVYNKNGGYRNLIPNSGANWQG
ncbi:hypothetical protein X275_07845 [Marinitoga sp. 1197]|uniref:flagellar export chaperone FlgN n=1 Tax=Marinitoga sp. 1197 TaxID=1428449 RepID=UPI00064110F0|nr:flagellar export chaperone FlgN [Marinitoga sp. 1197]KLO21839.1 hypothetical protein X275_07845 [Marinitoga sp. 1197]